MTWPTGQEYSDAIQSPRAVFEDLELQGGRVETNRLGLPKPRSGNFAVVYKTECGTRNWAVKCFTREVPDQQRRYAAISAHLRSSPVPYAVGFDYLARGIRVRGQWFPILKMEWISGDPLIRYIESHLRDPSGIRAFASRWVAMVRALRIAGIAHGDLQHGNVLVVGGDLKLVDYDGMFVPTLAGAPALEVGHPNYQHPGRATLAFGPELDNFSAWAVYVSLIALSIDPSLWTRVQAGDECLLFRASDFAAPDRSVIFKALAGSSDEGLQSLTEIFAELLRLDAENVPPLDAAKIRIGPPASLPQAGRPSWIEDHVKVARSVAAQGTSPSSGNDQQEIDASWVLDFIMTADPPQDARFMRSVALLRLTLGSSTLLAIAALVAIPSLGLSAIVVGFLIAANVGFSAVRYRSEPGIASLRNARSTLADISARFRTAAAQVTEAEAERKNRVLQRDRDLGAVQAGIRAAEEQARRETDAVKRRLDEQCAETQRRKREVGAEEQTALSNIARTTGARAAGLRNQLQMLSQDETAECAKELAALQSSHVRNALSAALVSRAQIPGVGAQLTRNLIENGIVSAADVDRYRVNRVALFGSTRVAAVIGWRNSIEQQARATLPTGLPATHSQALRAKYEARRQAITTDLRRTEDQQQGDEKAIKAKAALARQELDNLEGGPRATADREIRAIHDRRDQEIAVLKNEEGRVAEVARANIAAIDARLAALRKSALGLRWERARAASHVKAYAPITFRRYLQHVAIGFRTG